jgi:hypothetical protein
VYCDEKATFFNQCHRDTARCLHERQGRGIRFLIAEKYPLNHNLRGNMTKHIQILAASASAFALLATAPAFAQSADDIIIVSAKKRLLL